jgi:hypothetical protein
MQFVCARERMEYSSCSAGKTWLIAGRIIVYGARPRVLSMDWIGFYHPEEVGSNRRSGSRRALASRVPCITIEARSCRLRSNHRGRYGTAVVPSIALRMGDACLHEIP